MNTVMIIGLGSMGNRRLRLLRKLRPQLRLCGVDTNEARRKSAEESHGITCYDDIEKAVRTEEVEAAIVSTSPLSHAALIQTCLEAGLHVFTELNLVPDRYVENMALAREKGRVLFLSSTFLYRGENRYIIDRARTSDDSLNYRYHVGQYLPDWHPWERYQDYFVTDVQTNGCRELLAVELPWLCAAFGPIVDVQVIHKKSTNLHITYDDSYMILLRHGSGHHGCLCVDVVSRKPVRLFELYGENLYLTWGGQPETLREWDFMHNVERSIPLCQETEHRQGYADFIVENAYEAELIAFLAQIEQGIVAPYGFAEDLETLRWIDRIEGRGDRSTC